MKRIGHISLCFLVIMTASGITASYSQESGRIDSLTIHARTFIRALENGNFTGAVSRFDETMLKAAPPANLEQIWISLSTQLGEFEAVEKTRYEAYQSFDFIFVTCRFQKQTVDLKVVFNSDDRIAGFFIVPPETPTSYTAPDYSDPGRFSEEDITIGEDPWILPGTLTIPVGEGPFPGVVLVHGSGANDRDETIGPNKPFKDLAWGLASRGIAVLRYEKRTLHYAQQMAEEFFSFTAWDETIHDAVLAADRLRQDSRIDPLQIYVLGHSLGGYLAPRIGQMDPRLAGLIILAGGTRPLEEAFIEQITYIRSLETEQSEVIPQTETWLRQAERIRSLTPADSSAKLRLMGASPVYWLDLKEYDPPALAASLSVPILILQGKRDYQVTLEDFGRWKSALGNDSRVRFRLYSQLNHLFISGQGRITPAEYQNAGHVSLNVVEDITAWIRDPEKH